MLKTRRLMGNLNADDSNPVHYSTQEQVAEGLSLCCFHEHCHKLFLHQAQQLDLVGNSFLVIWTFPISGFEFDTYRLQYNNIAIL